MLEGTSFDYSSEEELLSVTFDSTEANVRTVHEDSLPEKKIFAIMEIAGESVQMHIDTGALCNFFAPDVCTVRNKHCWVWPYFEDVQQVYNACFKNISSERAQPEEQEEI